jgi:hypothetical protein
VRRSALPLVVLVLALPACAGTERPEGIVERWLISLNQGAAGEPERYARDQVSELLVPEWELLEPGQLDKIEVGRGRVEGPFLLGEDDQHLVPLAIERLDGGRLRATAILRMHDGSWRIEALSLGTFDLALPSEGGPQRSRGPGAAWLAALGVAIFLVLATAALLRLVPEPGPRAEPGA